MDLISFFSLPLWLFGSWLTPQGTLSETGQKAHAILQQPSNPCDSTNIKQPLKEDTYEY